MTDLHGDDDPLPEEELEPRLQMWSNDYETVIADSREDAIDVWNTFVGDHYVRDGYGRM